MQRRRLVAANWKMHGDVARLLEMIEALSPLLDEDRCEVALFPPLVHLAQLGGALSGAGSPWRWGAQDVSRFADSGPYTGEVSARMLADLGCRYALVGHSERRAWFAEGREVIGAKLRCAADAGLTPLLCVGETAEERAAGAAAETVSGQLDDALSALDGRPSTAWLVAYEPVWAIGSGATPTPEQVQEMHAGIRRRLAAAGAEAAARSRLLYGGSVTPGNVSRWLGLPDVDGVLVGGASLDAEAFGAICRAAARAGRAAVDGR